jgi:pimeloyl-ACP methyl ester carboxylesterase
VTWIEKRRVRVRGGELAFVDAGEPDSPAVVLIHGDLTSSFAWRHLIPMLAPWMRVIAPDLLGHGDSPAEAEADLSPAGRGSTVLELLDGLGVERAAAIGHGAGGGVAQRLAVDGAAEALVLIDAFAPGAWPRALAAEIREEAADADPARVDACMRRAIDLGMSRRDRLSGAELEEYLRPFRGRDGARAFARAVSAIDRPEDLSARLAELEIPALVLWGEEDAVVDAVEAERLGDRLPWASVALLPGCGHLLLEDAAETVAPLIFQWLRSRYLKVEHHHEPGPVTVYLGRRPPGEGG